MPSEDTLIEAIATVYDPEIPVNIYELGLIYAVEINDDGGVKVEMTLDRSSLPQRPGTAGAGAERGADRAGRDLLPRRDRLGSALGPLPHDRGSSVQLNMF